MYRPVTVESAQGCVCTCVLSLQQGALTSKDMQAARWSDEPVGAVSFTLQAQSVWHARPRAV